MTDVKLVYLGMVWLFLIRMITVTLSVNLLPIIVCMLELPILLVPIIYAIIALLILYVIFFGHILRVQLSLKQILLIWILCMIPKFYQFSIEDLREISTISEYGQYVDTSLFFLIFIIAIIKYRKLKRENN